MLFTFVLLIELSARAVEAPTAPLLHVACAHRLTEGAKSEVATTYGLLTLAELEAIRAVPEDAKSIRDFLELTFTAVNAYGPYGQAHGMAALWRRIPEMQAPYFTQFNVRTDAQLKRAWAEFKRTAESVMLTEGEYQAPPPEVVVKRRPPSVQRLAAVDPAVVAELFQVPWRGRDILRFMRGDLDKREMRESNWLDHNLNQLWLRMLGVKRPWCFVMPSDAFAIEWNDSKLANARLLEEWRYFRMVLNQNRPLRRLDP